MNLHEFVDWFREDLAYKAPEMWPGHLQWFFDEVKDRYDNVEDQRPPLFSSKAAG